MFQVVEVSLNYSFNFLTVYIKNQCESKVLYARNHCVSCVRPASSQPHSASISNGVLDARDYTVSRDKQV